jgi:hypothetical protein
VGIDNADVVVADTGLQKTWWMAVFAAAGIFGTIATAGFLRRVID